MFEFQSTVGGRILSIISFLPAPAPLKVCTCVWSPLPPVRFKVECVCSKAHRSFRVLALQESRRIPPRNILQQCAVGKGTGQAKRRRSSSPFPSIQCLGSKATGGGRILSIISFLPAPAPLKVCTCVWSPLPPLRFKVDCVCSKADCVAPQKMLLVRCEF